MSRIGNWISERRREWRFLQDHMEEYRLRIRPYLEAEGWAVAGAVTLTISGLAIYSLIGDSLLGKWVSSTFVLFGVGWYVAEMFRSEHQIERIIKSLKKEHNYNHVPTPPP